MDLYMDLYARDTSYMHEALSLARQAAKYSEMPVGAIITNPKGIIVGSGFNKVEAFNCQIFHAETIAIQNACVQQKDWRLNGHTLYVTLEPCMMCISLCALSRIERIVFGASSPRFGYQLDKEGILNLYTKQIKNITSGVCSNECARLLQKFFKK